jgi:hypothetical protein
MPARPRTRRHSPFRIPARRSAYLQLASARQLVSAWRNKDINHVVKPGESATFSGSEPITMISWDDRDTDVDVQPAFS